MNEREAGELRRRFKPEKTSITHIRGCYVNDRREIVAEFDQSLAMMTEAEQERFLSLLRRTLSGSIGRNLVDLPFSTQEVLSGSAHRRLMALKETKLQDKEAVAGFYETVSRSLALEGGYLILLAYDAYDVPWRGKDGSELEDASETVYSYILCSICPVKQAKPALSYDIHENEFHDRTPDWLISPPEVGFLFPAFDDRSANLYSALYYTRSAGENHPELIDAVFQREAPMPAVSQRENFQSVLSEGLGEDCRLDVVDAVRGHLVTMMEEHKANHEKEPLTVDKHVMGQILSHSGVSDERVAAFAAQYDEAFGADTALPPRNLVEPKKYELHTPDVTIQVNPERTDLVQTRVIDGVPCLLIRAGEGVELNGVPVQL